MKYSILFLILFFGSINIVAQQKEITARIIADSPDYSAIDLDTMELVVTYDFYFKRDSAVDNTSIANMILQIGKNYVKFTDKFRLEKDSIQHIYSYHDEIYTKEFNLILRASNKIKYDITLIRDISNNLIQFQNILHNNFYEYSTEAPVFKWVLEKESKTILGRKVYKTSLQYGNRDWVAWYTEDIPLPYGPYIFGDLSGLILEIYDTEDNFHFLATNIFHKEETIYKRTNEHSVKIDKLQYLNLERKFHKNPNSFDKRLPSTPMPYNPIKRIE